MSIFEGTMIGVFIAGAVGYLFWKWLDGRKSPEKCDSCSLSGRKGK